MRYKEAYSDILNCFKEMTAEELKRKLVIYPLGRISIPPLQVYLKQKNMTFSELI